MPHDIERYPRLAILLPHPQTPEVCAVDARTGTLPGLRIDTSGLTREQVAQTLARRINADNRHSVNRCASAAPDLTFYEMKPAAHEDLDHPYMWRPFDWQSIRAALSRAQQPDFHKMPDARKQLIRNSVSQAIGISVLKDALGTRQQEKVVRSFFFEVRGMYGLDALSSL